MYADVMTDSLKKAIDETNRRREIQIKYNKEHMAFTKELLNKAHKFIEKKKENNLLDLCDLFE